MEIKVGHGYVEMNTHHNFFYVNPLQLVEAHSLVFIAFILTSDHLVYALAETGGEAGGHWDWCLSNILLEHVNIKQQYILLSRIISRAILTLLGNALITIEKSTCHVDTVATLC